MVYLPAYREFTTNPPVASIGIWARSHAGKAEATNHLGQTLAGPPLVCPLPARRQCMENYQRPPMWNAAQVAEYLGTTTGRLANLRSAGIGPAYVKVGSSVRYRVEDIEAYVDANTVRPISA
jgi:hypothetical protein